MRAGRRVELPRPTGAFPHMRPARRERPTRRVVALDADTDMSASAYGRSSRGGSGRLPGVPCPAGEGFEASDAVSRQLPCPEDAALVPYPLPQLKVLFPVALRRVRVPVDGSESRQGSKAHLPSRIESTPDPTLDRFQSTDAFSTELALRCGTPLDVHPLTQGKPILHVPRWDGGVALALREPADVAEPHLPAGFELTAVSRVFRSRSSSIRHRSGTRSHGSHVGQVCRAGRVSAETTPTPHRCPTGMDRGPPNLQARSVPECASGRRAAPREGPRREPPPGWAGAARRRRRPGPGARSRQQRPSNGDHLVMDSLVRRVVGIPADDELGHPAERLGGLGNEPQGLVRKPRQPRQRERNWRLR